MNFTGTIIEESLENKDVLKKIKILKTRGEPVTARHKTPWIKQWTLHTVEIPEDKANELAEEIKNSLDSQHAWYVDFKNDLKHYIILRGKIFFIDRTNQQQYDKAKKYGLSIGIPNYQMPFLAIK